MTISRWYHRASSTIQERRSRQEDSLNAPARPLAKNAERGDVRAVGRRAPLGLATSRSTDGDDRARNGAVLSSLSETPR